MYPPMVRDEAAYFVKPMNCPFHVLIFKSQTRSYRELPMRLSELGTVYRYERAGTLHGLLRARGLTQDDSHMICTEDQLIDEILAVFDLTLEIHRDVRVRRPRRDPVDQAGLAIGDEAMWAKAIEALTNALEKSGLTYEVAEGEGAFYGPKVDFHFRDAIGRLWQLTTVQCDFALPERFEMEYVGRGQRAPPAGDGPPRDPRVARAVQRRADRALRRRVPAVALARAGPARPGRRPARRARESLADRLRGPRACDPRSTGRARRSARRSAPRSCRRRRTCS